MPSQASAGMLQVSGTKIWYQVQGRIEHPPVLYLHGGPGYNSYSFQKTIGPKLEDKLRMIYLDQRGCGRSAPLDSKEKSTIEHLVDDIEALRKHLRITKLHLLGHSFGGVLALEYQHKYPQHTASTILVDIAPNLEEVFSGQVRAIEKMALKNPKTNRPELRKVVSNKQLSSFEKLMRIYGMVDRHKVQGELLFHSREHQERMEKLDIGSKLLSRHRGEMPLGLLKQGYLSSNHPQLMGPVKAPTIVFAGKYSQAIGHDNLRRFSKAAKAQLLWFSKSGHFIYLEEPARFAQQTGKFVSQHR